MNFQLSNAYFGIFLSSLVPILLNIENMYFQPKNHPINSALPPESAERAHIYVTKQTRTSYDTSITL